MNAQSSRFNYSMNANNKSQSPQFLDFNKQINDYLKKSPQLNSILNFKPNQKKKQFTHK